MTVGEDAVVPRLRRVLTLRHLVIYGVMAVSPMGPATVFGVLTERGHGHVATAILIAMVAMLFTGISYGRMANVYPSAGSAFTYVTKELHPGLGYITGWSIVMDYVLSTMICIIWCAEESHSFVSTVPVSAWKVLYAALFTAINIQSIRSSARINAALVAGMSAVIVVIFVAAVHYLCGHAHSDPAFFTRPFYDPQTFSFSRLLSCTAVAVLTYIGFDAVSTLSEETDNPRRNVLLAMVLTCIVIGFLSAAEVYVAQLVWPAAEKFPDVDTAYVWVAARTWRPLFTVTGLTLLVATFAGGVAANLGASRLLYAMGRSNVLPQLFFGAIDPKHQVPRNNVFFVSAIALCGSFFLTFALGAEILNFGALIAFMGVNAAAFRRYFLRVPEKRVWNFLPPVLGFLVCFVLWWNLSQPAKLVGSLWMAAGIVFGICGWRGFRVPPSLELPEE